MNKNELCSVVSKRIKKSKKHVQEVLDSVLEQIKIQLVKGNEINLRYFGTFKPSKRSKRNAYDIHKKKIIEVPAKKVPRLVFSKQITEKMNK
jgi:nucleoid DNA-binding protein